MRLIDADKIINSLGSSDVDLYISVWIDKHKPKSRLLTKFIYWIGNIGIKKDGDDNET